MYPVNDMIHDMNESYAILTNKNIGVKYIFARLWDDYFYVGVPDEEILVFNIIIAHMNIKEENLTMSNKICIKRTMEDYEKNKVSIISNYGSNDMKLIECMVARIYADKEKWII